MYYINKIFLFNTNFQKFESYKKRKVLSIKIYKLEQSDYSRVITNRSYKR